MIIKITLFCILLFQTSLLAKYEVLGIGNPCVDYIQLVDDSLLEQLAISKGGWKNYDSHSFEKVKELTENYPSAKITSGGSACNTMKGLANLGISTAITGNLGCDKPGDLILNVVEKLGITSLCTQKSATTSQIASLVTTDGKRAFCIFNDAEKSINGSDLKSKFFDNVSIVHVDGHRITNHIYIETAMEMAHKAGALITFDSNNASNNAKFRERIYGILNNYVDVLFLNEKEAYALTHLNPEKACHFLNNYCDLAVIKVREEGCWIGNKGVVSHHPAIATHLIDPTGAGDLFASGFIYGLLKKAPISECARYGNLLGSAVLQHYGAEIPEEKWPSLCEKIK